MKIYTGDPNVQHPAIRSSLPKATCKKDNGGSTTLYTISRAPCDLVFLLYPWQYPISLPQRLEEGTFNRTQPTLQSGHCATSPVQSGHCRLLHDDRGLQYGRVTTRQPQYSWVTAGHPRTVLVGENHPRTVLVGENHPRIVHEKGQRADMYTDELSSWAKITRTVHGKGQRADMRTDGQSSWAKSTRTVHGKGQRADMRTDGQSS
ncbi:hypothetical protein DY000_02040737 [Brassica cretica]|uniref:Uncharacterized protein n=1 Tax=Brassica cretica TaxID=69181 RepID=A0ABQ7B6Y9_BRACR|nr:hypothetical protein DY000_02040737 [Brassica cretica]